MRHPWKHRRRGARAGDRGSVAVEAALVTPLVFTLLFGIIEMGFLFKDHLAAAGTVRAGARIASANPRTADFAQRAVKQVQQTGGALDFREVEEMWVYRASDALDSDKPYGQSTFDACPQYCVKFRWDSGTSKFVLLSNTWAAADQYACPSRITGERRPDRVGVYVKLRHPGFTGFVFDSVTVSEAAVVSLEPLPRTTGCN